MGQNLTAMSMDTRPQKQPASTYFFGKNGIMNNYKGSPQNEPGFSRFLTVVPGNLVGVVITDKNPIVFSESSGVSYIGFFNLSTDTYEPILNDSTWPTKLNFSPSNYIIGEAQRNFKNEIIVAFTDKVEEFRIVNADDPQASSAEDLRFFLRATAPIIDVITDSGGNLKKGAYFISVRYIKKDGAQTGYTVTHGPVLISSSFPDQITDRSMRIQLTEVDTSFDQVQIAIISKNQNEGYVARELDPIDIRSGTLYLSYTGDNVSTVIDIDEILIQPPVYKKVGTIGQLNDSLFLADLESYPEFDLQRYVNLVTVRVKSEIIPATKGSIPDEYINGKKKSLMHSEVYALFMRFHKTTGGYTKAFIIPGQDPVAGDLIVDPVGTANGITDYVYRVNDTNRTVDTTAKTCSTGTWINQNELFPNTASFDSTSLGGRDLRNQQVMHHKMPSLIFCKNNYYSADATYGKDHLDNLSLEISNVTIPSNLAGELDGWELLIAKRNIGDSTVLGQSVIIAAAYSNDTPSRYVSTGGNWRSASEATAITAPMTQPEDLQLDRMKWRTHSFDLLFNKPTITPTYLMPQLKMRTTNMEKSYPTGQLLDRGVSIPASVITPYTTLADYTSSHAIAPTAAIDSEKFRGVSKSKYLPNNINLGDWNSVNLESAFSIETNANLNIAFNDLVLNAARLGSIGIPFEETYLANLVTRRENVYQSYFSQELIPSGQLKPIDGTTQRVWPGDTFISDYTFHTYGWYDGNQTIHHGAYSGRDNKTCVKVIRRFVCESVSNIDLRYENSGNIYSKWYPHTGVTYGIKEIGGIDGIDDYDDGYIHSMDKAIDPNQFGYDKSLNALNTLGDASVFNENADNTTIFPYRIHRTGKLPRQGKTRSWRTILPLDYYEAAKNRGKITKVLGFGDRLLIHHENALFITESKVRLESGTLSVVLGTGDIFQFEPKEGLDSKQGYAGLQHELAGVQTPLGYIFPDAQQGQLFLFNGQLKLINDKMNTFLKDNLKVAGKNPFNGTGITIGWDQEYKRVLLTAKNSTKSFTMSFSPESDAWVFFHDYIPDFYLSQRDKLYNFQMSSVYTHNTGPNGKYYGSTVNPFFIDAVFRSEEEMTLNSLCWSTDVYSPSGVQLEFETLTAITIRNSYQSSGKLIINPNDLEIHNIKKTRSEWYFNDFRDIVIDRSVALFGDIFANFNVITNTIDVNLPWYEKKLFEDQYFIVRFEFDNNGNKTVFLHDVDADVSKSFL